MRLKFDEETDALYLRLDESKVVESEEVQPGVILDFDENSQVVGIEILQLFKNIVAGMPTGGLLKLYSESLRQLRERKMIRTSNNIVGDLTELLVTEALGLDPVDNSTKGFDARDSKGKRYQIKGRRITPENPSRQVGAIRGLEQEFFDYLVVVFYNEEFAVTEAYKIPHSELVKWTRFQTYANAHRFVVPRSILERSGVTNIIEEIRESWDKVRSSGVLNHH